MIRKLLISVFLFSATCVFAQDFNWQWAKRGGGSRKTPNESNNGFPQYAEYIKDIAVDGDNNYYFITQVSVSNTSFDGEPISVYNYDGSENGYSDVLLFSTTCDGTYRWSRVIGGGNIDEGYNISVDSNGGVYVSVTVFNDLNQGVIDFIPPYFSEDDSLPALPENVNISENNPGHKRLAIAKYSQQDGSLAWKKMLQGDVNFFTSQGSVSSLYVEADGTIHALVGLLKGTHFDGLAVVPDEYDYIMGVGVPYAKYFIVKLNSGGDYESVMPLDIDGVVPGNLLKFRYDPVLDHYYIGGSRTDGFVSPDGSQWMFNFGYNGTPFTKQMVLLALSADGEELWRKEFVPPQEYTSQDIMRDIQIDDESNIYICGRYNRLEGENYPGVVYTWGDFTVPSLSGLGHKKFIMKMNSDGDVLWYQSNNGYTLFVSQTDMPEAHTIGIGENEILLGGTGGNEIWNGFEINRPTNHFSDPMIVTLNKETGEVTGLHEIMGSFGYRDDSVTAIQMDNDGNYVIGGYLRYKLFTDEQDGVPVITSASNMDGYADFFIARLAATECGEPVTNVANIEANSLKIFPNPTKGLVTVQAPGDLETYSVTNLQGQLLLKGNFIDNIDLGALATGAYIITVSDSTGKTLSEKVIKQ